MALLMFSLGVFVVLATLWDIFQTLVLPRTLHGTVRLTQLYYNLTWPPVRGIVRRIKRQRVRESLLSVYGPGSFLALIAFWVIFLIIGFGAIFAHAEPQLSYGRSAYLAGTTLLTLGMGDEKPMTREGRVVILLAAGIGFGVLAIVVGYLPVLYSAFARREVEIVLTSSRAGTPPTAVAVIRRFAIYQDDNLLLQNLQRQEQFCAELLENHTTYPMLAFYRSHRDQVSWLSIIVVILDTCSLLQAGLGETAVADTLRDQAGLTSDMGRRVLTNLVRIMQLEHGETIDRISEVEWATALTGVGTARMPLALGPEGVERLRSYTALYEHEAKALSDWLFLEIPPMWVPLKATAIS